MGRRNVTALGRRLRGLLRRQKNNVGRNLSIEQFEQRLAMDGEPFEFRLSIFVDSDRVAIPSGIGVNSSGTNLTEAHTTNANGVVSVKPVGNGTLDNVTLGEFFTAWRTGGGTAGNNAAATFDSDELMDKDVTATKNIQMFVNGQVVTSLDSYVLKANDEIVLAYGSNPLVSLNTNFGSIVIELYETDTPKTVENFLNYVNDGDYINSIFHRSVEDFVIQGGGFKTSSPTFTNVSQFTEVPEDPTIPNEPGISNLRGTIAMAKRGSDPNSATSQFFVNLDDDNKFLDLASNNAFTVFGQILDMTTVDRIAGLPINDDNDDPYAELPLGTNNQLIGFNCRS